MPLDFSASRSPVDPNDLVFGINIIRQSPLGVTPMVVVLTPDLDNATGTSIATTPSGRAYQPRYSELVVEWSISPLGYTFDKIDRPAAYQVTEQRFGPMVEYVMRTPALYEVVCTLTDPTTGLQGVQRMTFNPADPSTVFTAANTWVVDANDVGLPSEFPGSTVVTTLNEAMDGVRNNADRTAPCKIVCLRGQTYSTSRNSFTPNTSVGSPSVHVVAAGTGAAPILNISGGITHDTSVTPASAVEHVWQGVVMQGTYDPESTNGPANNGAVTIGYNIRRNHPEVTLFDDFEMNGFHQYFASIDIGSGDPITDAPCIYMNDSRFTGYYYYTTIGNYSDFMMAGTFWGSDTNAWWGNTILKYGTRFSRMGNLCLHNSDVFTILSPSGNQGLFRTANEGVADDTKVQITGSKLVGGSQSFLNSVVTGNDAPEADFLIDRCMVLLSSEANKGVITSRGAFTMRSCFVIAPDLTYTGTGGLQSLIELASPDVPSGQLDAPVKVYSNTLVCLRSTAPTFINNASGFTNVFIGNNVTLTAAQAASADYDLTELWGTPILIGLRSNSDPAAAKDAGTTPAINSAALARPVLNTSVDDITGSVASGQVAYAMFDGSLNPGIRGALGA